jgi:hypothetical protein
MLPEEIEPYLIHRLTLVGWREDPVFSPSVYDELWRASEGIPRRLNGILSRLLLYGAVEELHELDGEDVRVVVADMGLSAAELTESARHAVSPSASAQPAVAQPVQQQPDPQHYPAQGQSFAPASAAAVNSPAAVVAMPSAPSVDPADVERLRTRVAALEAHCAEQDAAIRRILGLLINWVEDGESATQHGRAA